MNKGDRSLALAAAVRYVKNNTPPLVYDEICRAVTTPPAAQVQEPIGYLFQHEETGLTQVVDVQQVEWGFEKNNPRHQKIGPVYTTPPAAQRQWVGLTDEERGQAINANFGNGLWHMAKDIEAKLKEKNNG